MRRYAIIAALALAGVPAGAFAAQPSHPAHPSTPPSTNASTHATTTNATSTNATTPSKVMFVLRGTLSKYTAANGSTNGSISITVKSSNFEPTALQASTMTFAVSSKTNIVLHNGKPIAERDNGIVKVRAAQHASASTLQTKTAFEVIDQGASA